MAVLKLQRKRIERPELIDFVASAIQRWRPARVPLETVAYQLAAARHLRRMVQNTTIEEVHPDKAKRSRAVSWAAILGLAEALRPARGAQACVNDYVNEHVRLSGTERTTTTA